MPKKKKAGDGRAKSELAEQRKRPGGDIMHGRDFAGANVFATEREQTADRERVVRGAALDEAGETVTDAEVEARELRLSERDED